MLTGGYGCAVERTGALSRVASGFVDLEGEKEMFFFFNPYLHEADEVLLAARKENLRDGKCSQ